MAHCSFAWLHGPLGIVSRFSAHICTLYRCASRSKTSNAASHLKNKKSKKIHIEKTHQKTRKSSRHPAWAPPIVTHCRRALCLRAGQGYEESTYCFAKSSVGVPKKFKWPKQKRSSLVLNDFSTSFCDFSCRSWVPQGPRVGQNVAPETSFRTPKYRLNPCNGGPIRGKNGFQKIEGREIPFLPVAFLLIRNADRVLVFVGQFSGRFGPPRAPGWPDTDSPRKATASSGVAARIRAPGTRVVAPQTNSRTFRFE